MLVLFLSAPTTQYPRLMRKCMKNLTRLTPSTALKDVIFTWTWSKAEIKERAIQTLEKKRRDSLIKSQKNEWNLCKNITNLQQLHIWQKEVEAAAAEPSSFTPVTTGVRLYSAIITWHINCFCCNTAICVCSIWTWGQASCNITRVVYWDYLSWVWRTPFKKSKPAAYAQVKLWFGMRTEGLDPLIKTSIATGYFVFPHGISTSKVSINVTEMQVCIGPPGIIQSNPYNEEPSRSPQPTSLRSFNKTLQWRTQEWTISGSLTMKSSSLHPVNWFESLL